MKILKRVLLVIFSLLFVLVTTLFVIGKFYREEVINLIVGELNKQLITPVNVKHIDFSLLEKFPSASLKFSDIRIKEISEEKIKDDLIAAKTLYLEFNIFNILSGNYKIKRVEISDGNINIKIYDNGTNNLKIWKSDTTSSSEEAVSFNLQKVYLENVHFTYSDSKAGFKTKLKINKINASGDFNDKNYTLLLKGNLLGESLSVSETAYLKNRDTELDLALDIENNEKYNFKESQLTISGLTFNIAGDVNTANNINMLNLKVRGKEIKISELLNLLPAKYTEDIKDFDSEGFVSAEIVISGEVSDKKNPKLDAVFSIEEGSLLNTANDLKLDKIHLTGRYSNGNNKTSESSSIVLSNVKARLEQGEISGNLNLRNFKNPVLSAKMNASLSLKALKDFFKIDTLSVLEGQLKINVDYKGPIKTGGKYTSADLNNCTINGGFSLQNAEIKIENNPKEFKNINGEFVFSNTDLVINRVSMQLFSSTFNLKGSFKNLLPFILFEDERLEVKADLDAPLINFEEIFSNNTSKSANEEFNVKFSDRIDFDLAATVNKILFRKFSASDFTGKLSLHNQKLSVEKINFRSMDGNINMSGVVDGTGDNFKVVCETNTNKINIQKMFYQIENFGQNYIEDKNLKGSLTGITFFKCEWDKHLNADINSLEAKSTIVVEKGELNNFEPMLNLSKFIDVNDLKNIKFNTLKNTIEISKKTIVIPQMEISSNALNITLSGRQTFEGLLDYHFKVLLNDLLAKKARAKKENNEFGEVEDDGLGKITLYLSMTGTTDNPKFSYDKRGFKEKLKDNIKTETHNLKELLNKEFGMFKKDTTLNNNKVRKRERELGIEFGDKQEKEDNTPKPGEKKKKPLIKVKKNDSEKSGENSDDYN